MPVPFLHPSELKIKDFVYNLPEHRIARFPLPERDLSKLLILKNGNIREDIYRNLDRHLPKETLLLFNQAKVIHARLHFVKPTGGRLEIFCLEPDERYPDITTAMMQDDEAVWKCLLKGAAKWKGDEQLKLAMSYQQKDGKKNDLMATAEKISRHGHSFTLKFKWETTNNTKLSFSEFLHYAGQIPIPPYLKRRAEASDETRYQTIFAQKEGSVAAPTAALHFTPLVLQRLKDKAIDMHELTLHVGAGTFMPVKSEQMKGHEMHSEWIEISKHLVECVIRQIRRQKKIVTVGTTSARTIESLYWIGVRMLRNEWNEQDAIAVEQWYPYRRVDTYSNLEALEALLNYFEKNQKKQLITRTQLIIAPGYDFKIMDGLITNFHQPASTLLLMIAAFVGEHWHKIYDYALAHDFRFLSYGDGSLLWRCP